MPSKIKLWPLLLLALALLVPDGVGPRPPHPPLYNGPECYPWRALQAVFPEKKLPYNQRNIGTCVAVAGKGVIDGENAVAYLMGKMPKPQQVSAESLYGGRVEVAGREQSRYGDGWYGVGFAKWVTEVGGQIYEKNYPEYGIDLSNGYVVERARDWGQYGNGGKKDGINGAFDAEAKKNKFAKRARVSSLEELDASMKNYKFVHTCSNIGYDSPRDADGFCQRRGSWSHAQFFCGRRTKAISGRDGYLVQNSWGAYIAGDGPGSKNKYLDQPDGSYWVSPADALAMLRAGDSWVLTYDEFKASQELPWMHVANAQVPAELLKPDDVGDRVEPLLKVEKPSTLFAELLKPVPVKEFAKLNGIAKPEARPLTITEQVDADFRKWMGENHPELEQPKPGFKWQPHFDVWIGKHWRDYPGYWETAKWNTVTAKQPQAASACANGSCSTFTRRRWFR